MAAGRKIKIITKDTAAPENITIDGVDFNNPESVWNKAFELTVANKANKRKRLYLKASAFFDILL